MDMVNRLWFGDALHRYDGEDGQERAKGITWRDRGIAAGVIAAKHERRTGVRVKAESKYVWFGLLYGVLMFILGAVWGWIVWG